MKTFLENVDGRFEDVINEMKEMLQELNEIKISNKLQLKGEYFLTDMELSNILKVSRRTLQEYRYDGTIAYYKLDGKILYRESDIEKMLQKSYRNAISDIRLI